jgi:phospholipid/cholesterol/gamma-HCH transport system substrate-binding protein
MKKITIQVPVGFFVLIGILSLAYVSIKFGNLDIFGGERYSLYATFDKVGGMKPGAAVQIAGIQIGKVKNVQLNEDYQALVELSINREVKIQEDAIVSIRTKGLIGGKYVLVTPGGADTFIQDGGKIRETESAIDIEDIMSKFIFGEI